MSPEAASGKEVPADEPDQPEEPTPLEDVEGGEQPEVEAQDPAEQTPLEPSSQAIALKEANEGGKPFCKKCEEAKKKKEQEKKSGKKK